MDETHDTPPDAVLEMDKPALLLVGRYLGDLFLQDNPGVAAPQLTVHWPKPHRHPERGWYRPGRITVNLPRCRPPTRTPGFAWSFPGYKADMTPVGVYTHELGHHVDTSLGHASRRAESTWRRESAVSGYEPNRAEAFAEAFRLFLTNPNLLREGRPQRWALLTEELGLVPSTLADVSWADVLRDRGAHERFLGAAANWVRAGHA